MGKREGGGSAITLTTRGFIRRGREGECNHFNYQGIYKKRGMNTVRSKRGKYMIKKIAFKKRIDSKPIYYNFVESNF